MLAAVLAVALACAGLGACSGGSPRDRRVALARDLVVTLPPGSLHVTARRVHTAAGSPLVRPLAAAEHVSAGGRLGGRAVLTFHVGHVSGRPFLAWLDGATWVPVASAYNATAGTVSAVVSHFSTWAPFTWVVSQVQQRPGYTVPATDIICAGPYVTAGYLQSAKIGARVLLEQEVSGLKLLTTGSGPLCTTIPAYALPGQVVDVPARYGHALDCIH